MFTNGVSKKQIPHFVRNDNSFGSLSKSAEANFGSASASLNTLDATALFLANFITEGQSQGRIATCAMNPPVLNWPFFTNCITGGRGESCVSEITLHAKNLIPCASALRATLAASMSTA